MTSESARVSDFRPHGIFAVKWHRICDLTVSMIDKTSSGFNMCCHKNSLPSTLILYRPALLNWWAVKLLQVGRKMFRDNLNVIWKKLLVATNCIFLEKVVNYESQKCIIVAFHPRNAPIFNNIITPSHEFWNKFFVKCVQNQSLGEKWAMTSKRLRSTGIGYVKTY